MAISSKSTCLINLKDNFVKAHNEFLNAKTTKQPADIGVVLFQARKTLESICDYIILDTFPTSDCNYSGEIVLKGRGISGDVVNGHVWKTVNGQRKIIKVNPDASGIKLSHRISIIHERKRFSSDDGENDNYKYRCNVVRYGGNKGAHNEIIENKNPSFTECEESIIMLRGIIEWFYKSYDKNDVPQWYYDVISTTVVDVSNLARDNDWYILSSEYKNFQVKNTQYVLITAPNFKSALSEHYLNQFAQSIIDWHLVIDFDAQSQDNGVRSSFERELGLQNIVVFNASKAEIDFSRTLTYWYLAQEIVPQTSVKAWNNTHSRKLKEILTKSKAKSNRNNIVIVCVSNENAFINSVCDYFNEIYGNETSKIKLALISNNQADHSNQEKIEQDFAPVFGSVNRYIIDFHKLSDGFSLTKRISINSNETVAIPAFSDERRNFNTFLEMSLINHQEFKTQHFFDIIHKNIGKTGEINGGILNFYLGNEITWEDLAWQRGKGKDIPRTKTDTILNDVQELLKKGKGFHKIELLHEPSAGGTTVARRIAYEIGTDENPTIIIHKYNPIQTYKGIEKLYGLTNDKPILAIIEDHQVDEQKLNKLRDEIITNNRQLVVLYIKRTFGQSVDKVQSKRTIEASLDDEERRDFEHLFSTLKAEKKNDLKSIGKIYENDRAFITPFIYGLTAFDKNFQRLESYVESILKEINDDRKIKFITFVCLIGKYIKNPIPETTFYKFLNIDFEGSLSLLDIMDESLICKILKYNKKNADTFWEVRHKLVADEVCEQVLGGRNLSYKNSWRSGLKNYLIDLIDVFEGSNTDMFYDDDREILEALFTDTNESKTKFSKLIEEINKNDGYNDSIDILKYLTKSFPEHAYFKQHLARLYDYCAKDSSNASFYNLAIEEASQAVEVNNTIDSLLHTKGYVIVSKIKYILDNFKKLSIEQDKDILEEEIKSLYFIASDSLERCIEIDKNSTYGYTTYIYLVTYVLEFGTRHAGYDKVENLLEDPNYDWYIDKVSLGFDLIENLRSVRLKSNETDEEFSGVIRKNYEKLSSYMGRKASYYEDRENSAGMSNELKIFYRNAFIIRTLKEINFANPNEAWAKLSYLQVAKIVEKLKANIRYEPKMHDVKRYLQAVRIGSYSESLKSCKDFLTEVYEKMLLSNSNDLILAELSYYLYVLNAIQEINNGEKIDDTYFKETLKFLQLALRYRNQIKKDTFEFEFLGKNRKDGLEQIIERRDLGEFNFNEFTSKTFLLAEVKGKITSSSERQKGTIKFNYRGRDESFTAFFVPIKGGITEEENGVQKEWRFDEKKYEDNMVEVMFYLGFSYSGFRAWQPIPVGTKRANQIRYNRDEAIEINVKHSDNGSLHDFKVMTVNNNKKTIDGKIKGVEGIVSIQFQHQKSYEDYKLLRREIIKVRYVNYRYELLD